jgi:hypothetical protein
MARSLFLLSLLLCFTPVVVGQENLQMSAPPPMKFISSEDRNQLEAEKDIKKRSRLTIELAEAKLIRAEQLTNEQEFSLVITELGRYQGLVENVLTFLDSFPKDKNKIRDTYKKLEISLRAHIIRIEGIRRITPSEYAENLKKTIEFVRDARDKALNCFYDDTVIPDKDTKKKKDEKTEAVQKQPENTTAPKKPDDKKQP